MEQARRLFRQLFVAKAAKKAALSVLVSFQKRTRTKRGVTRSNDLQWLS
jgi:phage-related protein